MAAAVGIPQTAVSRVEHGRKVLDRAQLAAWLAGTNPTAAEVSVAWSLLEEAHAASSPWHAEFRDAPGHLQDAEDGRTRSARLVQDLSTAVVPGLLQTAAYTRALLPLVDLTVGLQDHAAAVRGRQARQDVLYEAGGRRFEFLVTERALAGAAFGPELMVAQRARVESSATLDAVAVWVLPDSEVNAEAGFVLYDDVDDGAPAVSVELPHGRIEVSAPEDVTVYRALFAQLRDAARPL